MKTDRRAQPGGRPPVRTDRGRPESRRPPAASRPGREVPPELPVRGELVYGRNAALETLRGPRPVFGLFLADGIRADKRIAELVALAGRRGIAERVVPRDVLDRGLDGANHQGVALDAAPYRYADIDLSPPDEGMVTLALDHVQDPRNLGTLLRTADACGVHQILIPTDRAVVVTPAVVNASAGAVEHLRIALVTNLARTLDDLKAAGWWVVGLEGGGESTDLFTSTLPRPVVLVVGSEGEGIGRNVLRRCDMLVRLPMRGRVSSLNAATAASVALYHLMVTGGQTTLPRDRSTGESD